MHRCSAPWYELNISGPDNIVSACCYYAGKKDPWHDSTVDIGAYWNSPAFKAVRRINGITPPSGPNGCSTCFYFQNRTAGAQYFDFSSVPSNLSAAQLRNFEQARKDYELDRETSTSTPLRIYVNFGFACNLACTMCHQVPRREANRRQVTADSILAWRDALQAALDVTVIGGEPFAIPQAVAFIRAFIDDPAYENVRLGICTNGTVHHKHISTLRKKRKLSITISLDSIGSAYDEIRVNGKWSQVEKNLLDLVELQRSERPEWHIQTNALIMKTGISHLPQFAEWHARHGITTSFYDFINSRGTEDAYYAENALHNPQILDDMPDWEEYFDSAIKTFSAARMEIAANTLNHYRLRLVDAVRIYRQSSTSTGKLRATNAGHSILTTSGPNEFLANFAYSPSPGATDSLIQKRDGAVVFSKMREGDHFATRFFAVWTDEGDGAIRARLHWPADAPRRAHIYFQSDDLNEIPSSREFFVRPHRGYEAILTARLPRGRHRVRLVALPVGEDESTLPSAIEFDLIGSSPQPIGQEGYLSLTGIFDRAADGRAWARDVARRTLRSTAPSLYSKLSWLRNQYRLKRDRPPAHH